MKGHVLKLLADTVTLAARYDGWLLQLSDELYALTQKANVGRRVEHKNWSVSPAIFDHFSPNGANRALYDTCVLSLCCFHW